MTNYTALLALPNGEIARDAAARLTFADNVSVVDDPEAGVWLSWATTALSDQEGIAALQEIRLRAEMAPEFTAPDAVTPTGDRPTLFQATPFIILRGAATIIHSEEVICI